MSSDSQNYFNYFDIAYCTYSSIYTGCQKTFATKKGRGDSIQEKKESKLKSRIQ